MQNDQELDANRITLRKRWGSPVTWQPRFLGSLPRVPIPIGGYPYSHLHGRPVPVLGGYNSLVVPKLPHTWLFPHVSVVVHHGGPGTTGTGLRAGVPSVLVPHIGDQSFWARRVMELGVGPQPIPRRHLTQNGWQRSLSIRFQTQACRHVLQR